MRYLLAIAMTAAPAAALAEPPAITQLMLPVPCVAGDVMLSGSAKLGERQFLHGDTGQGTQMVLAANPDTGRWTVFIVTEEGVCVISTGEGLTPGAIQSQGQPS